MSKLETIIQITKLIFGAIALALLIKIAFNL
jgi:hypothetical protein